MGDFARGASPEGVLHLAGNVAEWVEDACDDEVVEGLALERFVRNDLYAGDELTVRGSVRTPHSPLTRRPGFGFRLADSVLNVRLAGPIRA